MARTNDTAYAIQTDVTRKFHYLKRTVGLGTETTPQEFDALIESYIVNGWVIKEIMSLGQYKDPQGNVLGDMFGVMLVRA